MIVIQMIVLFILIHGGSLVKVRIPDSVTTIDSYAFNYCRDLKNVEMSRNVEIIASNAFSMCKSLKYIYLPDSLISIGAPNTRIASDDYYIYGTDTAMNSAPGLGAFNSCTSLNNITIPVNLVSIGSGTFYNCTNLTDLKFAERQSGGAGLVIGTQAFQGSGVKELTFSYQLKAVIMKNAFENCKNLQAVAYSYNSICEIDCGAFLNCIKLNSFANIHSVKTIKFLGRDCSQTVTNQTLNTPGVFEGCTSLKSIDLSGVEERCIPSALFKNCKLLETVELYNAEEFGKEVFRGCTNLGEVRLYNRLNKIYKDAFGSGTGDSYGPIIRIVYDSTKNNWQNITKENGWKGNARLTVQTTDGYVITE